MHNKNIYGDHYTNHLFCLFLQFCEEFKLLYRAAFVQHVQFSHIFKRDKLMPRKDPLHCDFYIIDMAKWQGFNSSLGFFIEIISVN